MNAAQRKLPLRSTARATSVDRLSSLRSQAAFVRALLDEIERVVPSDRALVSEQLVEELARLGHSFLDVAAALSTDVEDDRRCA